MPTPAKFTPSNVDVILYSAVQKLSVRPVGEAMRLVRAATDGTLDDLWVKVEKRRETGGTLKPLRSLMGMLKLELPANATVWINDATADRETIESVLKRAVIDRTP